MNGKQAVHRENVVTVVSNPEISSKPKAVPSEKCAEHHRTQSSAVSFPLPGRRETLYQSRESDA